MKLLKRNETDFTYTAYAGKEEILNNGRHTGKFTVSYANPVPYRGHISIPSGQTNQQLFGIETVYTHVLLMDDSDADIREDRLIQWKGCEYEIKAVRPSLNVLAVALKKTRLLPESETPSSQEETNPNGQNEGQTVPSNPNEQTGDNGEPADPVNPTGEVGEP